MRVFEGVRVTNLLAWVEFVPAENDCARWEGEIISTLLLGAPNEACV